MSRIPTGAELARPFMPARDFARSKRFYEAVGFETVLDGDVAIFKTGCGGFILQRFYQKESPMQPRGLRVAYLTDPPVCCGTWRSDAKARCRTEL